MAYLADQPQRAAVTPAVQVTAVANSVANPWWADYVKTVVAAGLGAAGTIGASWLGKRAHPKIVQAETSERIANAFDGLVDRLQADNKQLSIRLTEAEGKLSAIREDMHKRNNFIDSLRGFARAALNYAAELEEMVLSMGGTLPERPKLPDFPTLN